MGLNIDQAPSIFDPLVMTGNSDTDGSVIFPNGLIMKWGKQAIGGGSTPVVFATPFPNACFQAFANGGTSTSDPDEVATHSITVNGFTLQHSTQTNLARWFAVGR